MNGINNFAFKKSIFQKMPSTINKLDTKFSLILWGPRLSPVNFPKNAYNCGETLLYDDRINNFAKNIFLAQKILNFH